MESTLGKRIMQNRKRLGFTQDKLADILGVSPQAISKWENDQSCPDISMLPRLAELFQTTTDELLGMVKKEETAESETSEDELVLEGTVEDRKTGREDHNFEINWMPGRQSAILFAVLVLTVGVLTLLSAVLSWDVSFWSILWPCAIIWCGIVVLVRKFSFFGIACLLFGGYFLLENLSITSLNVSWKLIFPILILLLGLSLLVDAFKKPKHSHWNYHLGNQSGKASGGDAHKNDCHVDGETYTCSLSFGETVRSVSMDKLSAADLSCCFGELTVNFCGVKEFEEISRITADCSFGELRLLVPRSVRVEPNSSTAFASVRFEGTPDSDCRSVVHLEANVSFGEISVCYI